MNCARVAMQSRTQCWKAHGVQFEDQSGGLPGGEHWENSAEHDPRHTHGLGVCRFSANRCGGPESSCHKPVESWHGMMSLQAGGDTTIYKQGVSVDEAGRIRCQEDAGADKLG